MKANSWLTSRDHKAGYIWGGGYVTGGVGWLAITNTVQKMQKHGNSWGAFPNNSALFGLLWCNDPLSWSVIENQPPRDGSSLPMDGQLRRSEKSQILSVSWQQNFQNMIFLDTVFLQNLKIIFLLKSQKIPTASKRSKDFGRFIQDVGLTVWSEQRVYIPANQLGKQRKAKKKNTVNFFQQAKQMRARGILQALAREGIVCGSQPPLRRGPTKKWLTRIVTPNVPRKPEPGETSHIINAIR